MLTPITPMRALIGRVTLAALLGAFFGGRWLHAQSDAHWFKGNLHTHSLWSDGDDYPEMIAAWYKQENYHFLAMSDHNILAEGTRWFEIKSPVSLKGEVVQRGGGAVLQKYLQRFGADWVEQRQVGVKKEVRLKPLDEYRVLLEEPGRFLMIPSEEITGSWTLPKTSTMPERSATESTTPSAKIGFAV